MSFNPDFIIKSLRANQAVFEVLLSDISSTQYLWKPATDQWCLLEVVCHLLDEECEDFRARLQHVLNDPEKPMASIDPAGWVESRAYLSQDYDIKLKSFLEERSQSIAWLETLESSDWSKAHNHRILGVISGATFLSNWLAHDYLHIRQINRLKFQYHAASCEQDLTYAGGF